MLFTFLNVLLLSLSAMSDPTPVCEPKDRDIVSHPNTRCFKSRTDGTVRAILVHYGSAIKTADLDRLKPLLINQFAEATGGLLRLEVLETKVVPLKIQERDLE